VRCLKQLRINSHCAAADSCCTKGQQVLQPALRSSSSNRCYHTAQR
jgi:hypothetical protein